MPRTDITINTTGRPGGVITWTAADMANDHEWDNTSKSIVIIIDNQGALPVTPTFITEQTVDGNAVADLVGTAVAAGTIGFFGPFKNSIYANSSTKVIALDIDYDTSVYIAALKVGTE
jgi:hypothetical protein